MKPTKYLAHRSLSMALSEIMDHHSANTEGRGVTRFITPYVVDGKCSAIYAVEDPKWKAKFDEL